MLTEKQVAKRLGVSVHWVQAARWRGGNSGPPYVKVVAAVRYDERDLDQWIQERERTSTTDEARKQRRSPKSTPTKGVRLKNGQ
jgi:predicted DNA-binding transcriptional regulator AlpA